MNTQIHTYELPENLKKEINDFEVSVNRYKSGEMSETEFKVIRVPFGCYEQRKKDTYMVRIRCAGSIITPTQLERVAQLSEEHSASYIHITSRQEIQLHYVLIDSLIPVARGLKEVGLSPRGGGGNTVRNIIAEEQAGIAPDEAFDVSPYAVALTTRMIAEPDSWNLPRKFKYAFSGSEADRCYATIHDVGYIAKIKDGKKGFKVYFAGGLGAKTQISLLLFDFVPEEEVYNVAKAVKNVFHKNGNRKNKHAARLRYLVKTLGEEELTRLTLAEYEAVKKENYPPLKIHEIENIGIDPNYPVEKPVDEKQYKLWLQRFIIAQKQKGLNAVILPSHLGHMENDHAIALANFLKPFGENTIRIRKDQNFLLRNISDKYLPNLFNFLNKTFEGFNRPFIIDKILSCAGASTCQLGICLSPGATTASKRNLENCDLDLDLVSDAKINISGCPNSCGQHHIADIGFFGKVTRKGDKVYPTYNVVAGGHVEEGKTALAVKVGEIASRDLPNLVQDSFRNFISKKDKFKDFHSYMQTEEGMDDVKNLCAKYKEIPDYDEDHRYYMDWGTDKLFSVADKGKGECSAGIFDLIESDFGNIQAAKKLIQELNEAGGNDEQKGQYLKDIIFFSSRVLLVARALQPKSEHESYNFFRVHFINEGLVDASVDELIKAVETNQLTQLNDKEERVYALADRMKLLYDVMNPSFQFVLPENDHLHHDKVSVDAGSAQADSHITPATAFLSSSNAQSKVSVAEKPTLSADFRGVGCPMNFVKTKMELSKIQRGDTLEILLDDGAPIENVPGSVRQEGHKVIKQEQTNGYWTVLIEKS